MNDKQLSNKVDENSSIFLSYCFSFQDYCYNQHYKIIMSSMQYVGATKIQGAVEFELHSQFLEECTEFLHSTQRPSHKCRCTLISQIGIKEM